LNQKPNHTALLIFSRTSAAEAAAKNLYPSGKRHNLKITHRLIQQAKSTAKSTGLPFFVWDETVQVGASFGERLTNAMEALYNKGFQQLVVIGNDSVHLTANDITRAADGTAANNLVLIPTLKGGVSLIGLHIADFNKERLASISWQTGNVFTDLQLYAFQMGASSVCFAPIDDVNNLFDLKNAINLLSPLSKLKKFLADITAEHHHVPVHHTAFYFYTRILYRGLRAPPSLVSFR
jgi:glycosyltransferase A (GT-A) superfamily protein (DUF2064 family)